MGNTKYTGGNVPYGYVIEGDALVADKERSAVILDIFESKAAGMSLQQIADMLNRKGVKTLRGGEWTKQGIKYIHGNRAYIGEYSYNGVIHTIPKIVSGQLFAKINGVKTLEVHEHTPNVAFNSAFIFEPAFAFNNK
jgi:site-specific DNA recombinase